MTFTPRAAEPPAPSAEALYDNLYPYYAEVCAASQLDAVNEDVGGKGGHETLYLHGVCRKAGGEYPLVEMCPAPPQPQPETEQGVGISVDKAFKNVNWVVVPDRDLFYHGGLAAGETVTKEKVLAAERAAVAGGWLKGIEIHEEYRAAKRPEMSEDDFIAHKTIGTDYALDFSRSMMCVKIPVEKTMMEKAVAYLNAVNQSYADGTDRREWDVYQNNCAHTLHNALAAAGIGKVKKTDTGWWLQWFYLAVPSNEFEELASLANRGPLENFGKIYGDKILRRSLTEDHWLPMRHGAHLRQIDSRAREGAEIKPPKILIQDALIWGPKRRSIRKMLADRRCTDLKSNLVYFRDRYREILKERPAAGLSGVRHPAAGHDR